MLLEFWKRKPKKSSHEIFNFFHGTVPRIMRTQPERTIRK